MSEQIITKRCCYCKQIKTLSEFNKNRSTKDNLTCRCRMCRNIYQKYYRESKRGKIATNRYTQSEKGKATRRKIQQRFRIRHPNRHKPLHKVSHAIEASKLSRPDTLQCNYCPNQAQEYHHYKGYAQKHWLDVIPVCRKCHRKIHNQLLSYAACQ